MSFHVPEDARLGAFGLTAESDSPNNGAFALQLGSSRLRVVASDGGDWEHVSISLRHRWPMWDEVCHVKSIFWDADDTVLLYPAPNTHEQAPKAFILHLWRHGAMAIPLPPETMYRGQHP